MSDRLEVLSRTAVAVAKSIGWSIEGWRAIAVPARLCLGVEHGDYNGFLQMGLTVDRYNLIVYRKTSVPKLRLYSYGYGDYVTDIALNNPQPVPDQEWTRFPVATLRVLALEGYMGIHTGLDAVIVSDIPGGGMSRSAALCLGLIDVIDTVNNLGINRDTFEFPFITQRIEHELGSPCGLLDPTIEWFARDGQVVRFDPVTKTIGYIPIYPTFAADWMFAGLYTGRDRKGLSTSRYPERVRECQDLLAYCRNLLGNGDINLPQVVRSREYFRVVSNSLRQTNHALFSRLKYLHDASARLALTTRALEAGDGDALGQAISADGIGLNRDYNISGLELEAMVEIAKSVGWSARMAGGGDVGTAMAWGRRDQFDRLRLAVDRLYPTHHTDLPYSVEPLNITGGIIRFDHFTA